jgi:hypothetical protein
VYVATDNITTTVMMSVQNNVFITFFILLIKVI